MLLFLLGFGLGVIAGFAGFIFVVLAVDGQLFYPWR
jgi:hypothetical protein